MTYSLRIAGIARILPDRLMVGLLPLEESILVRIQVRQQTQFDAGLVRTVKGVGEKGLSP